MNRIEFMTQLAALLQDIPVVERKEAMKYYNDYFDDAGEENEQEVISELESPEKVAETIKADLGIQAENHQGQTSSDSGEYREYTETGYRDTRFDYRKTPAGRENWHTGDQEYSYTAGQEPPRTNKTLKIILIIAIILVAAPVVIPVVFGVGVFLLVCTIGLFALFIALVIGSVAIAITGVALFIAGIWTLVPEIAVGLALMGTGMILGVLGVILTVVSIKLCIVAVPGICRGIVWLCRRPFQGRAVA